MPIPLPTTTITITRRALVATEDPYDEPSGAPSAIASGVRAHISPRGAEEHTEGRSSTEDVRYRINADTADLQHTDLVVDETTDQTYAVVWAENVSGLGLDHTTGELRRITGNPSS